MNEISNNIFLSDGKIADDRKTNNLLWLGNCLEEMSRIPDKSIDLICCDLPYGTTACSWDIIIPFKPLWEQYKRIIKDGGNIALFGKDLFGYKLALSNEKWFKYEIVWNKEQGTNQFLKNIRPLPKHETIYIFNNGNNPTYNPVMVSAWRREIKLRQETKNKITATESKVKTNYDNKGLKYPTSVIDVNREHWRNGRYHSTQKPIILIKWLIETYSNKGETVLDNACGSDTTGIASFELGRNSISIENDLSIYKLAKKRREEKNIITIDTHEPLIIAQT